MRKVLRSILGGNGGPSTARTVTLELPPGRVLCSACAEILRPTWPRGYATAAVRLFALVTSVPAFHAATDAGDPDAVARLLDQAPLCFFLPRALVEETIRAAIVNEPPPTEVPNGEA